MIHALPQVQDRQKAVILSILCFSVYMVSYIGRLNYSAALTEMTATGILSKPEGGAIATAYFLCYGAGQFANGFLADRCRPIWQITAGMAGSIVQNLLMTFAKSWWFMLVLWGANGYFQSLIWAPAFRMVSQSIPAIWRNKSLLLLNIASPAGAVAAYLFSSLVLGMGDWRHVFSGAAVCMGIFSLIWVLGSRYIYQNTVEEPPVFRPPALEKPDGRKNDGAEVPFIRMLVTSCGIYFVLPAAIHGMLKDGITNWLPVYMSEVFSIPSQTAVAWSVFLPVINMFGAVIAYFLMLRVKSEALCTAILFTGATGVLILLLLFGALSPVFTILLFSTVTVEMMAVNVLFCSEIPSRFSYEGRAAAVSGFFNSCGYIGTAASTYTVAWISDHYGWTATQLLWIGACLCGLLCGIRAIPGWKEFLNRRKEPPRER